MALSLSASKRVAYHDLFMDLHGRRPSGRIRLVSEAAPEASAAWATSWSAFASGGAQDAGMGRSKKRKLAGEHVAVAFNRTKVQASTELFFHVAVFRCDTWALQWVARASSADPAARVLDVCCLSANIVAFLVECKDESETRAELCIATRFSIPSSENLSNVRWRSFISEARVVDTGFTAEGIRSIQALSATSLLVLTGSGRLVRATVSRMETMETTCEQVASLSVMIRRTRGTHTTPALVVSRNCCGKGGAETKTKDRTYAAVLNDNGSKCYVLDLMAPCASRKLQHITFPKDTIAERVEFAGSYMLVVTLRLKESSSYVLQFTCLVPQDSPSEGSFTMTSFDLIHLTARRTPLATMYDSEKETHIVVSQWQDTAEDSSTSEVVETEQWWRRMEFAEVSLASGPYTTDVLRGATWLPLPEPFRSDVPALRTVVGSGVDGDDGEAAEVEYHQELSLLNKERVTGSWLPLYLHYALATPLSRMGDGVREVKTVLVTVFAIETAPFVHTRLAKQWHNAVQGLLFLLGVGWNVGEHRGKMKQIADGVPAFAVPWNPGHMRRALRLFGQRALRRLFSSVACALRHSAEPSAAQQLFYGVATTSLTDVAMQIITLSRRVGAHLRAEDVETVVLLLRASRDLGHAIVNHTTRSQVLLECIVKGRMAGRVLGGFDGRTKGDAGRGAEGDDEKNDEVKERRQESVGFLSGASEMRVERMLHNRYTTNDWSQQLLLKRSQHADVVAQARLYLNDVLPFVQHKQEQPICEEQKQQRQHQGREEEDEEVSEEEHNQKGRKTAMNDALLPDWVFMGRRPHADAGFTEYEGILLRPGGASN
ncbi:uncharacterized protein TEOVI_000866800 [Trypanosoma equiperdum]|uniref:Uncharacterized protein n=1 Tax=Trypanosoma equiperdum TaxID=5694 RepID=A0A1G4I552_TRYEQ|nr:hypothetical protein, conserved [Trypanosoma equiperdum]